MEGKKNVAAREELVMRKAGQELARRASGVTVVHSRSYMDRTAADARRMYVAGERAKDVRRALGNKEGGDRG